MKVTVDMTKNEASEYIDSRFIITEDEYKECIQLDVVSALEYAGFSEIEEEDVTVNIND